MSQSLGRRAVPVGAEGGLVALYAYPHTGATLLSRLLNSIPGVAVTPEMAHLLEPVRTTSWKAFREYYNRRFSPGIPVGATVREIDEMLKRERRLLFYRVWVPADNWRGDRMDHLERALEPVGRVFLHRNFLHVLGSLHSRGMLPPGRLSLLRRIGVHQAAPHIRLYRRLLDLQKRFEDSLSIRYRELVADPRDVVSRILSSIGSEALEPGRELNLSGDGLGDVVTGDYKAMASSRVRAPTRYPEYLFTDDCIELARGKLGGQVDATPPDSCRSHAPMYARLAVFLRGLRLLGRAAARRLRR